MMGGEAMPRTAVIHIGTRKTGTTSIQETLASAGNQLGEVGYPLVGRDRDQNRMISLYVSPREMPLAWQGLDPVMNRKFRKVFFRHLASKNDLILSAESMASWFPTESILQLRADLESAGFDRFCVVLFVRDPADYFLSFTQQVIKSTFVSAPYGEHWATFKYPFRSIAERWESVFPGSLVLRKYPGEQNGDVVRDFSMLLKKYLRLDVSAASVRSNASLSAEGMKILQDYRLLYHDPSRPGWLTRDAAKLLQFLRHSTGSIHQTRACLDADIARGIRANHKEDAEFILHHYGVDLEIADSAPVEVRADSQYLVSDLVEHYDQGSVEKILLLFAKETLEGHAMGRALLARIRSRVSTELRACLAQLRELS